LPLAATDQHNSQTPGNSSRRQRLDEVVLMASFGVKISVVEILRGISDDTRGRKIQAHKPAIPRGGI